MSRHMFSREQELEDRIYDLEQAIEQAYDLMLVFDRDPREMRSEVLEVLKKGLAQ